MKKKVIVYPQEYLGETYISPRSMRKNEAAQLIDLPWHVIKKEIRENVDLAQDLEQFHYKPSLKFLHQTHVAILFLFYGPPLASLRNLELYRQVCFHNDHVHMSA